MPAQATRVNQLVCDALGLDVEPGRWRALSRQVPEGGSLDARIRSLGGAVDVGYVDRTLSAAEWEAAVTAGVLPVVLLPPDGTALVATRDENGAATLLQVGRDGVELRLATGAPEVVAAARSRVGRGAVPALAPLALRPAEASRGTERPHSPVGPELGEAAHAPLSPVERTLALLGRERREVLTVFFYATLSGGLSLVLPLAVGGIVQLVQGRLFLQPVIVLITLVILGTVVAGAFQVGILRVVERIQQRVFARMAMEFAFRVPRMRYGVSLETNLPEQMNRLFEAVAIQKGVQKLLLDVPTALLTILFGLLLLTVYSPWFSVFAIIVSAAVWWIMRWTGPEGLATSIVESKYKYKAVHWLEELARAFHAFKYAGDSTLPVERMDDVVTGYLKYRRKHFAVLVRQTVALIGFKTLITAAVLILGATLVQANQLLLGQFVAAEVVIINILVGVEKLIASLSTVYDVLTSVDKAGHVADLPLEGRGGMAPEDHPGTGMAIETRALRVRYPGSALPAVDGVSLRIEPGERVALMGVDGSGRSTLLKALGGLLDAFEGTIRLDGVTLRDLDRPALRARVGQMLSWTDLFDGTIEENIHVGRAHLRPADVQRVLDDLDLTGAVQQLSQGLQTEITNGGRSLPAHLANKLLVAQGIVGAPRLVVLDDFFQNLDAGSRALILAVLTDRARPWTVLAVSNDPLLLEAFDRVLVIEHGRLVADGPFRALRTLPLCRALLHESPLAGER